jgi:hypothetical protein
LSVLWNFASCWIYIRILLWCMDPWTLNLFSLLPAILWKLWNKSSQYTPFPLTVNVTLTISMKAWHWIIFWSSSIYVLLVCKCDDINTAKKTLQNMYCKMDCWS